VDARSNYVFAGDGVDRIESHRTENVPCAHLSAVLVLNHVLDHFQVSKSTKRHTPDNPVGVLL